jgi:hypothetical protein
MYDVPFYLHLQLASMAKLHMSCHLCINPFHITTDVADASFGRNLLQKLPHMVAAALCIVGRWLEISMVRPHTGSPTHLHETDIVTGRFVMCICGE